MNNRGRSEARAITARLEDTVLESESHKEFVRNSVELLFEAEPMVHPNVLDAYEQAIQTLRKSGIPFRETGGIALNFHGAGRPTKHIDLIVRRSDWLRAIQALGQIATDRQGIRFGLADEPEQGLAVIGPHGISIELWPDGTTHEQIARVRGMQKTRRHPAGKLALYTARRCDRRFDQRQTRFLPLSQRSAARRGRCSEPHQTLEAAAQFRNPIGPRSTTGLSTALGSLTRKNL